MSAKVAVVDDDQEMLDLLTLVLTKSGYEVKGYATPGRFFDGLAKARPDVTVLDMHLPGMDGRDVIRVLRANADTKAMPIVAISAVARSTADVVQGLELGADEYMAKPVDLDLLVARIAVLLRRAPNGASASVETVRYGDVIIYPDEHRVQCADKDVPLTHLEFKLLLYFLKNPNRVLTRGLMLEKVWGTGPDLSTRTVDKHVETLRKKLPSFGGRVETVIRVGYLFRP
ncbi:MAG: response regulator transcription factor [Elusimicrobiota bacterium]|nr:response regulator transcription factor [Elusimicrobiota bacterium]